MADQFGFPDDLSFIPDSPSQSQYKFPDNLDFIPDAGTPSSTNIPPVRDLGPRFDEWWAKQNEPRWTGPSQAAEYINKQPDTGYNQKITELENKYLPNMFGMGAGDLDRLIGQKGLQFIADQISGLTSNVGAITGLASFGEGAGLKYGIPALTRLSSLALGGAAAPTVVHGTRNLLGPTSTLGERASGALETAIGGLMGAGAVGGLRYKFPTPAKPDVLPAEPINPAKTLDTGLKDMPISKSTKGMTPDEIAVFKGMGYREGGYDQEGFQELVNPSRVPPRGKSTPAPSTIIDTTAVTPETQTPATSVVDGPITVSNPPMSTIRAMVKEGYVISERKPNGDVTFTRTPATPAVEPNPFEDLPLQQPEQPPVQQPPPPQQGGFWPENQPIPPAQTPITPVPEGLQQPNLFDQVPPPADINQLPDLTQQGLPFPSPRGPRGRFISPTPQPSLPLRGGALQQSLPFEFPPSGQPAPSQFPTSRLPLGSLNQPGQMELPFGGTQQELPFGPNRLANIANARQGLRQSLIDTIQQLFSRQPKLSEFFGSRQGTADFQQMWDNLKRMLGRDPTAEELDAAMHREARPGEPTGMVAPFHPQIDWQAIVDRNPNATANFRLPDGRIVTIKEELARGAQSIDYEMSGTPAERPGEWGKRGEIVKAVRVPDPGFQVDTQHPGNNLPPVDPNQLQQFLTGLQDATQQQLPESWKPFVQPPTGVQPPEEPLNMPRWTTLPRSPFGKATPELATGRHIPVPLPEGQLNLPLLDLGGMRTNQGLENVGLEEAKRRLTATPNIPPEQQLSMEGQMKDAEISDYLKKYGPDKLYNPPPEEPQFARVKGGGLTASVDIRRAVENITRDYTSPLPGIMNREGMQNALDAADKLGMNGTVRVRFDGNQHSMEIHDNGHGLDENGLANKLVEIFATGKEGEAGATGGKGIGSASYIYGGEHFTVQSTAVDRVDGKKYTITASGTPDQFLDPVKGSEWDKKRAGVMTPTGTTIRVQLKPEHNLTDARDMMDKILANSRDRNSRIVVDHFGHSSLTGTPINKLEPTGDVITEHRFPPSSNDKMVGDFTTTNRNSQVKVLIPKGTEGEHSSIDIHYLNNGMYQFSEQMHLPGTGDNVPEKVLVDIHPLVDDQNELYPFINTREDIKRDIRDEITKFIKDHIASPGISKRKSRIQELYDSMKPVPIAGTNRKSIIYDPGNRLTPQEMNTVTSSPVVQELVQTYDNIINDVLEATGRQNWKDRLEGVGMVFDPTLHGVHIPNPSTGKSTILVNPFNRIAESTASPAETAFRNVLTNLHEVAHIGRESGTPIQLKPEDLNDPRVGEFLAYYMNELVKHGDVSWFSSGHGMDFAHRLGEVYARYGVDATFNAANQVHDILTAGEQSGGYNSEVQRLLQLYTESRGRAATTEDLLTPTGTKQRYLGPGTEGNIPSDIASNADRATSLESQVNKLDEQNAPDIAYRALVPTASNVMPEGGWREMANRATENLKRLVTEESGGGPVPNLRKAGKAVSQVLGKGIPIPFMPENVTIESIAKELAAFQRTALPSGDWSATTRQLGGHFMREAYRKAWGPAHKAYYSQEAYDQLLQKWENHPFFQKSIDVNGKEGPSMADRWGIKLHDIGDHVEETLASEIAKRIPGYTASNRQYAALINGVRVNKMDEMVKNMINAGDNPMTNLPLGQAMGDFIMTSTGSAPLRTHYIYPGIEQGRLVPRIAEKNFGKSAEALAKWFFAPKLQMSRARMLNPLTYYMAPPGVRSEYVKAAVNSLALWGSMLGLGKLAGADISTDADSADFMKIKIGNLRIDPGQGYQQYFVPLYRLLTGQYKSSSTGRETTLGQETPGQSMYDVVSTAVSNKLAPSKKFYYDLLSTTKQKPMYVTDRLLQTIVPLQYQDVMAGLESAFSEGDLTRMLGAGAAFVGLGNQYYHPGQGVTEPQMWPKQWDYKYEGQGLGLGPMLQKLGQQVPF